MTPVPGERASGTGCSIVGVGTTEYSRASGRTALALATEASLRALDDAGIKAAEVDGIVRCTDDVVLHNDLIETLALPNVEFWAHGGLGGTAPSAMIGYAVNAIRSGSAKVVLAYRSLNGRSGRRVGAGYGSQQAVVAGGEEGGRYDEYFLPYGLTTAGQMYALIAQRHMTEFGTTREQLGHIAMTCRRNAQSNPAAQMYGRPMTMDDYFNARMISSPLGLFDYSLETDGACAVVVTSTEQGRDSKTAPIAIAAVAQGGSAGVQAGRTLSSLMRKDLLTFPSHLVAENLYRRANLGPSDIDVAQLYDCFTITVLVQLEDYGFCVKGEGGPFAASGALDTTLPINTSGGHLSEAYMHGMNHVVEGVRQLRGESTRPVPGAEVCLVSSGAPPATSAMILTVDR
ncbi:MAG: lipid-transfer protein [Acidimicrobiaceae bacterium]|nr:lipid-transfer protein [Acidimicrobiaceae bacterium]